MFETWSRFGLDSTLLLCDDLAPAYVQHSTASLILTRFINIHKPHQQSSSGLHEPIAQVPLRRLSLNLPRGESRGHKSWKSRTQMVTSDETMRFRWKLPTQITKVADTNHLDMSICLRQSPWQVRDKPVSVALIEFSQLQCTGKVGDKVHDKVTDLSRTQIMKVGDVICDLKSAPIAGWEINLPWTATVPRYNLKPTLQAVWGVNLLMPLHRSSYWVLLVHGALFCIIRHNPSESPHKGLPPPASRKTRPYTP